jgi:hypothetical protein
MKHRHAYAMPYAAVTYNNIIHYNSINTTNNTDTQQQPITT